MQPFNAAAGYNVITLNIDGNRIPRSFRNLRIYLIFQKKYDFFEFSNERDRVEMAPQKAQHLSHYEDQGKILTYRHVL